MGRSGTLQVTGTYAGQSVTLDLRYDYGADETFTGTLADSNHIVGTASLNGQVSALTFTRR